MPTPVSDFTVEEAVYPVGPFEAYSLPFGGEAIVISREGQKVKKRFKGESAWSNAARHAGDMNSEAFANGFLD
jgi:hypothetical protein